MLAQIPVETLLDSLEYRQEHKLAAEIYLWEDVLRENFSSELMHQVFEPILGCLKKKRHSIQVHKLEKDLIYLSALNIAKCRQLFLSLPVSPVSLGILLVTYFAHLSREARDIYHTHHAVSAKDFVIWIRPQDNGQISNLRITKAFNLIDPWDTRCNLSERIICLPAYKFDESAKSEPLKVVMVRSLAEAIELLKHSKYCSLVVLDDPSGRTYPSPSAYGSQAFGLASLCKQKQIPMVGIVPAWTMRDIEYHETNNPSKILLWPIDFFALRSSPAERELFVNGGKLHPIEESYLLLERKRKSLIEAQVTIKTFYFDTEDEEKIAQLFQESSDLLLDLTRQPQFRTVGITGWEIWRHLSAPVLPFHILWNNFLASAFKRLKIAIDKCGDDKGKTLYDCLYSLAMRLQKLKYNPFLEIAKAADRETIVAVEDAERANAIEQFFTGSYSISSMPQILPISQLQGMGGEKLIVIGQPKAYHRNILQTTFFRKIDVLLWSVLSERAERWWSNLEVDAREWHRKTWQALTEKQEFGRYSFSPQPTSVQVINTGKAKLSKSLDLSQLEESFSTLSGTGLDSGLTSYIRNLKSHYLIEFEQGLKIRAATGSEFLVLLSKQAQIVAVTELTAGTKVVLFDGMNRDELFAQKAGLLEDTKVNYLYRIQLDAWRELVKKEVKKFNQQTVCRKIFHDTGLPISEETIQYNWMNGDDLLSLPREKEHFFWFLPPLVHSSFEDFWQQANELRIKRRQLGQVISACAQEGWKDRKPDEIVFQYKQVFITVGELRDAMQVLKLQSRPQLIHQQPEHPINRLFR